MSTTKKIIFRADGNSTIGLGHVYRMLALAEMLKDNFVCEFVVNNQSRLIDIIPSYFAIKKIPKSYNLDEEYTWIKNNYKSDTIIAIDGYNFSSEYQKSLKQCGYKIVYIDDLQVEHMYADAVINHSPNVDSEKYCKEDYTALYLGSNYILLRNGFLEEAKKSKNKYRPVDTVLISMGGADENNITKLFLETLENIEQIKQINIIVGAAYMHLLDLELTTKLSSKNVVIFNNLTEAEIIKVMQNTDVAFCPCSNTCFEFIALNKTIFAGYSANNQKHLYNFLRINYIFDLSDLTKLTHKELLNLIIENIANENEVNNKLKMQKKIIDGKSKERIIEIFKKM